MASLATPVATRIGFAPVIPNKNWSSAPRSNRLVVVRASDENATTPPPAPAAETPAAAAAAPAKPPPIGPKRGSKVRLCIYYESIFRGCSLHFSLSVTL